MMETRGRVVDIGISGLHGFSWVGNYSDPLEELSMRSQRSRGSGIQNQCAD